MATFESLERLEAREREIPGEEALQLMAFRSEERKSYSSHHFGSRKLVCVQARELASSVI